MKIFIDLNHLIYVNIYLKQHDINPYNNVVMKKSILKVDFNDAYLHFVILIKQNISFVRAIDWLT